LAYADETLQPIVEDQIAVFESQYKADLNQVNKSESELINLMLEGKAQIAVLSRRLSDKEEKAFTAKKIKPRITRFAFDAIALISNKESGDTIADLQEVINLMQGKESKIKGLVFDNPNSSTTHFMDSIANVSHGPKKNIYSVKSHEEVLKYVSENSGVIGVVGLNGITQPYPHWQKFLNKINVLGIKNVKNRPNDQHYYKPSQSNLGAGLYPLRRPVYMLNYQGTAGLGMGFASFVAGDIGQRIILQSGLLPVQIPERNIIVRNKITNNK
jgi:phosphate transport system substrate-binding protein